MKKLGQGLRTNVVYLKVKRIDPLGDSSFHPPALPRREDGSGFEQEQHCWCGGGSPSETILMMNRKKADTHTLTHSGGGEGGKGQEREFSVNS